MCDPSTLVTRVARVKVCEIVLGISEAVMFSASIVWSLVVPKGRTFTQQTRSPLNAKVSQLSFDATLVKKVYRAVNTLASQ